MYSHQCVKAVSCRECLVAFPAQLNPDKYSSLIKIVDLCLSRHCFSLFKLKKIYSQSLVGNKQANKNPKWVLKLPVPYFKNPRETQKETAAINRTYGNTSLALKLDIEFVQRQTPQGQLRALTCSFLQLLQLLLTDSIRRGTKASGSRISSCQRLCVRNR